MPDDHPENTKFLIDKLLTYPKDQLSQWLALDREPLELSLLEELKKRSDRQLLSEPKLADDITERALILAQHMPHVPLATPLAFWARGNWAAYHNPEQAVSLYQQALNGYRQAQNPQITVRLLSNLIFAALQCGQFETANEAYDQSLPLLNQLSDTDQMYLVSLNINYGLLLHEQGRFHDALVFHERAHALAKHYQKFADVVGAQVNRALTLGMMGQLAEVEEIFLQSRSLAIEHELWLTVARIDMNLGELYVAQGRPAEALRSLQAARQRFEMLGNSMEVGSVILREADLLAHIGAWREARRSYSQAQTQFTELQMLPEIGKAMTKNAVVNRRYGEYAQAVRLLDEADQLWQTLDQPIWRTFVLQERVALALAQGEVLAALALLETTDKHKKTDFLSAHHDILYANACADLWQATSQAVWQHKARNAFEQVLVYAQHHGDRWLERQALVGLGMLLQQANLAAGLNLLEQALAIDETMRQALSVEELKASFLHQHNDLLPLLVRLAVQQDQPWQALRYIWHAKGGAMLDLFQAAKTKLTPISVKKDALNTEIESVRQELARHRWQITQNAANDLPESMYERTNPEIRQLEQRLYELRRQRNRLPVSGGVISPDDPVQLLQRLSADVLIEYMVCDAQILAVRVDHDSSNETPSSKVRCQTFWLCDVDIVLDLLDEIHLIVQNVLLQTPMQREKYAERWVQECRPLLQQCYDLLIAPLQEIPHSARLLIAPCEALNLLPFAAFSDGKQYLGEQFEIEMTPTAALLAIPPMQSATTSPLVIAASAGGKLAAVQAEAAAIQASWPDCICQLDDPRSASYLAELTAAPRFLHMATHSVLREDTPIFTALQFVDGMLSVEQCYDLSLQGTELVTLSSCRTASGMATGGALLALQSAFFTAGAQRVLTSLWPIDDETTARWMKQFYAYLATGVTPAAALRSTQQALLGDPAFRHPALWAAFACYRR